ncbi:hypothetical protein BABINDRAFT_131779 [Babjeviella inositovora NRRL Y-12698]|uniref:Uncharacterized protein n=1 Tax=Babjeviella inositovora NRRL Y-12698 TaxID=984486 RepID=A0A1E3QRI0_9ASCO|nr:uncharacterized protein BABINDRAFT_131779 [Babjeviella inositovora NRRL Y-12698]ODQ80316.1 hypothetical protein BABINDRAFT_131779 [Babjeviella inositovora NRRL Y-12698]
MQSYPPGKLCTKPILCLPNQFLRACDGAPRPVKTHERFTYIGLDCRIHHCSAARTIKGQIRDSRHTAKYNICTTIVLKRRKK